MRPQKGQKLSRELKAFQEFQEEVCQKLAPYEDCANLTELRELGESFRKRTEDFFASDRKFHLAVLGQMKSGKTTFLNTLLFGGRELLPRGVTPQTAVLTRIEYGAQDALEAEFYSPEDWLWLERLATREESAPARAAAETLRAARAAGLPVQELLFEKPRVFPFETPDALRERLREYTGRDGKWTPLVKTVTLRLCREELRELVIVDTPGWGDPLPSRAEQVREAVGLCDAAFFLSRAGRFLDRTDRELLLQQLPRKGLRRLWLVASQFDSLLMDLLYDSHSLEAAAAKSRLHVLLQAADGVDAAVEASCREGCAPAVTEVLRQCRRPVIVSAMAQAMAEKPKKAYTKEERVVEGHLKYFGPPSPGALRELGNWGEIETIFRGLLEEKDTLLRQKAAAMTAAAKSEFFAALKTLCQSLRQEEEALPQERGRLSSRIETLAGREAALRRALRALWEEFAAPLEARIALAVETLGESRRRAGPAAVKRGVRVETEMRLVSDSVLYKPWTWGRRHREVTSTESRYPYMDTADTVKSLRQAAEEAALLHAAVFAPFADTARLENRLREAVCEACAACGESRAPAALNRWLQAAKNRIVPPRWRYDPAPLVTALESCFPGEVLSRDAQEALQESGAEAMDQLTSEVLERLTGDAERFRQSLREAEERFCGLAVAAWEEERSRLEEELAALEAKSARRREFLALAEPYGGEAAS